MILKYLVIALILYAAWRVVRRDFLRKFARTPSRQDRARTAAIETVQCPRCGLYLPEGMEKSCGLAACPWPVPVQHD